MLKFKPTKLTLALLSTGLIASMPTVAQQAEEDNKAEADVEVIQVSGFRRSLIQSQAIKASSSSVVEAISAEDIGKLPDSSIAESLARMPGLAAQRLDGRASKVSIRGFGENEGATTFNGREQVSIGDNRGAEFDLYPSEIMNEVVVYKTPDARLEAEGIAGVIDLRTIKPLNKERKIVLNGQYEMNSLGKLNPDGDDTGARATFAYIDQFADDKLGVAIAATSMNSPGQEERWNAWGARNIGLISGWGAAVDANGIASDSDRVLEGAKPFVRSSMLKRSSVMGVIEYQPNDKLNILADALYVDFSDEKILRGIEIPGVWADGSTVVNAVSGGVVTEGTIMNQPVVRNDYEIRDAELNSYGLNIEYDYSDNLKLEFDISHSSVERQIWSMENYSGYGDGRGSATGPIDTITYSALPDMTNVQFNSSFDFADYSMMRLGGPLSWGASAALNDFYNISGTDLQNTAQDGFINAPEIDGDLTTFKFEATQYLENDYISNIVYGISYKDREKTKKSEGYFLTLKDFPNTIAVPEKYRLGTADLSFLGMGQMIAYDSRGLVNDGYYNLLAESATLIDHLLKSWNVQEEVTSLFVQANIETEVAGMELTGNIGVRHISTDQTSTGFGGQIVDGLVTAQPTSISHDFSKTLPSLNLRLAIDDEQSVRFGVGKTLSRPRLDEMHASLNVEYKANSTAGPAWAVSGGNPTLEPKEALGVDLSYENYFSDAGYFSAALYWKDISKWIFDGQGVIDLGNVQAPGGGAPINSLALVSGKFNGGEGTIKGYELSVSYPLGELHEALDGFGIVASHTGVSDNLERPDGSDFRIPGLSEKIQNFTLYYEKNGFQARTSMRKRSEFKGDIYSIGFTEVQVDIQGETIWDAQIGYDFGEGGFENLDGLSIFLQGQNINDEPFHTMGEGITRDYQVYGSTYLLGFSYTM